MDTYNCSTVKALFFLLQRPSGSERLLQVSNIEITGWPEIFSSWGVAISVKISCWLLQWRKGIVRGIFILNLRGGKSFNPDPISLGNTRPQVHEEMRYCVSWKDTYFYCSLETESLWAKDLSQSARLFLKRKVDPCVNANLYIWSIGCWEIIASGRWHWVQIHRGHVHFHGFIFCPSSFIWKLVPHHFL